MERDDHHESPSHTSSSGHDAEGGSREGHGAVRQLKRVRKLDEDSDSEEDGDSGPFQFQSSAEQDLPCEDKDVTHSQPAPKKMRKWVDSDSDSESSSSDGKCSPDAGDNRTDGVADDDVQGEACRDSDSDDEGQLKIDLDHQPQSQGSDEEMAPVNRAFPGSPIRDTLDLLGTNYQPQAQRDDVDLQGDGGSLAPLIMIESAPNVSE